MRIVGIARTAWSSLFALSLLGMAACEPVASETAWTPAPRAAPAVVSPPPDTVESGESFAVTFDQALDRASVGSRSVRVRRPGGGVVPGVRLRTVEDAVWIVVPAEAAAGPAVVEFVGRPAPGALRSRSGVSLASTERFEVRLARSAAVDLEPPVVVETTPAHGSTEVPSGRGILLEFSEPLARGPVRSGDAVELLVEGRSVRRRLRLSADGRRVTVRPARPLPPGSTVTVNVSSALLDRAGNPAVPGVATTFSTRTGALHELSEDFATQEMVDERATTSDWARPERPGHLVAATRRLVLGPSREVDRDGEVPRIEGRVRVQVLVASHELPDGYASAVALRLHGLGDGVVLDGRVRLGLTDLERLDPSFQGNLRATQVQYEHTGLTGLPLRASDGTSLLEIPLEQPVATMPGLGLLLDVEVDLPDGVTLNAVRGDPELALDDDGVPDFAPDVALLLTTGTPMARSRWYDSGFAHPDWGEAIVDHVPGPPELLQVEFQSAPGGVDGQVDPLLAGDWEASSADLPRMRFVRFRVRFVGFDAYGQPAALDRVVLPYTAR